MSSTTTLYLDASYDSKNYRSEFRFPKANGVYKTDMRLLNVGLDKNSNGATYYNQLVGAYGIIQTLSLYSGSQLIDEIRNVDQYLAIRNLLHSNAENQAITRVLTHNKLGFSAEGEDDIPNQLFNDVVSNENPDEYNVLYGNDGNQALNGTWLDLRVLPFLDASPYVPMNVFPDLRLVVTYKSRDGMAKLVRDQGLTAELFTKEPLVICEYEADPVMAEALMKNYQGVVWNSIEHDQVYLNASAPAQNAIADQTESWIVKGFNGKYISKMIVSNQDTNALAEVAVAGNANNFFLGGSVSQLDYALQLRLNGAQFFPTPYIQGYNRRLAHLVDAWGDVNIAPYFNAVKPVQDFAELFYNDAQDAVSRMDYTGFTINDVVSEMKLTIQRSAVGHNANANDNIAQRQALNISCFGVSKKQVLPASNGILVRYV